ncbi:hypothetical protein SteCoe_32115 [Stentor coeruleus]|uniref:Protein kinase domain-containing protein n=1 Tax=Stentor coeruleus TaxID=5963 RepID=A0A1R2AZR5_9CILI|nr:hypothetical protein SteCoe_32115 [Stentor coeruleus]
MSLIDQIFIQLLRNNFGNITLERDSIHFSYHLNSASIPQECQELLIGIHFYKLSIKFRVTNIKKQYQNPSQLQKLLEMIHKLNLVLDDGSIKYDNEGKYIYYSNYLNREGYSPENLLGSFHRKIDDSIKSFRKFLEFTRTIDSENILDYESRFVKNTLDNWIEKKELRRNSSDNLVEKKKISDSTSIDQSSYDENNIEKYYNKNSPELLKNDEEVIGILKNDQNIWEMCDSDSFNDETFEYEYNPVDTIIVRLKKYTIQNDLLIKILNFMVSLWNIDIVFENFPLDWIMISVNEKNETSIFKFALKFTKTLNYYKSRKTKFENIEDYKTFISNKMKAAINTEYDNIYPQNLLKIEDFAIKDLNKMELIYRGGFGKVVKNTYHSNNVAIKYLKNKKNTNTWKRIVHEFNLLNEVNDQYIIKAYGLLEVKNKLCLVMEYCDGGSLEKNITSLQPDIKLNIMKKVAIALQKLHTNKIIHCDIKPLNILLSGRDMHCPKIIDFGLAFSEKKYFQEGYTLLYASLEQLLKQDIDFSTDVWSYGITFYRVLEEKFPFYATDKEVLIKILNEFEGLTFSKINGKEKNIIEECLKKNKDERIKFNKIVEDIISIENSKSRINN